MWSIPRSTRGIIFLGTPHNGSDVAKWGVSLSKLAKVALGDVNDKIIKGLMRNNELLSQVDLLFRQILSAEKFRIHSFYETKPITRLRGKNIVVGLQPKTLCEVLT